MSGFWYCYSEKLYICADGEVTALRPSCLRKPELHSFDCIYEMSSADMCPLGLHIYSIQGLTGGHEKPVSFNPTETDI
jgi:hypothetical protein